MSPNMISHQSIVIALAFLAVGSTGVLSQSAGDKATSYECFTQHAVSVATAGGSEKLICAAVVHLAKCVGNSEDQGAQNAVDTIVAQHNCDPDNHQLSPTVKTTGNHLHMAVDEGKDVKFFRFRREETSVWELANKQTELESKQTELDTTLDSKISDVESKLSQIISDTQDAVADIYGSVARNVSGLTNFVNSKTTEAIQKSNDAIAEATTQIADDVDAKIAQTVASLNKQMKNVTDMIMALEKIAGDCNYATHYKNTDGECVQLTDCSVAQDKVYHGGWLKGERPYPSFIWKRGTKTTDHVCGQASSRYWYRLDDKIRFHVVPWPKWKYPKYTEMSGVNVCRDAGLLPWRDEGAWNCNPSQYVCDHWSFNLGGHDLMYKMSCQVTGAHCSSSSNSGQYTINKSEMAADLVKMGFEKKTGKKIRWVTKESHGGMYDTTPSYMDFQLTNSGEFKRTGNSPYPVINNERGVVPDLMFCAYVRN